MAETLKSKYGPEIVTCVADMVAFVAPEFPRKRFITETMSGYDALELMDRGRRIATQLHAFLPGGFPDTMAVLLRAIDAPVKRPSKNSLSSFLYLPFTEFVARHGLDHVDMSMAAMHVLTQRFTAEFCIRPFLIHHQDATLAHLRRFVVDPSADVRRLVSEGTRPRLPWAPRLPVLQANPDIALEFLEQLKDDPSEYVRRSVANHLNDIGKDFPERLIQVTRRWAKGASSERKKLVRHALRSLLKAGDGDALAIVGHAPDVSIEVMSCTVSPKRVPADGFVMLGYTVHNTGGTPASIIADCRVGYVRADGSVSPKVFRMATFVLASGESRAVSKKLSLTPLTTRKHYPGRHPVEAQVNGQRFAMGEFDLRSRG